VSGKLCLPAGQRPCGASTCDFCARDLAEMVIEVIEVNDVVQTRLLDQALIILACKVCVNVSCVRARACTA